MSFIVREGYRFRLFHIDRQLILTFGYVNIINNIFPFPVIVLSDII